MIYKLKVLKDGSVVKVIEVAPSLFPGQGIAADPKTVGTSGLGLNVACFELNTAGLLSMA